MQNKNAHVSQKEVPFPSGTVLISKTDTKGVITYCNDAFVDISGYSREELIGRSHNIVRHPDMPPQAFKWLWDTMKVARPWRGVVKNRCKSGDHYWVRATVAPVLESGKIIGYVSVRRPPTRAQIAEAEQLYRKLNQTGEQIVSKYEKYKFKNWTLTSKLQVTIQLTLLLILTAGQFMIANNMRNEAKLKAVENGNQLANEVIDGANMLMVTGQISDEGNRKLLIQKIAAGHDITAVRLVRTQQVIDKFGPGLPEEQINDEAQRKAIADKKPMVMFAQDAQGNPTVRVVTPYIVSKNFHGTDCTGCHGVAEGTVNGASDISISLKEDYERISWMEIQTLVGQLALHAFLYVFIGFCVNRYVRDPVRAIHKEMLEIREGGLDHELDISIQDEVGSLLCDVQSMQTFLRTMVDEIVTPSKRIYANAGDVDGRMEIVADNAMVEQGHILSIAATMEQLSQSIAEVAAMAADTLSDAKGMQNIVAENNRNMELSVVATGKVARTVQSSSQTISDLGSSVQKIGTIANVIKDIAEQTNLLALNAAIEAARAGEQGRGFAVVADEVRKLAERTATSTKDITSTIAEITAVSESAVKSMHGAVVEVETGIDLIRKNGEGLREIMSSTTSMSERVGHIATASREQATAGEDVAGRLERITVLVDSNTDSAKEAKVATEQLAQAAGELRKAGYPLTKCAIEI
jgi:PAS domain S-box-containing protein